MYIYRSETPLTHYEISHNIIGDSIGEKIGFPIFLNSIINNIVANWPLFYLIQNPGR